jgi:hypothetical protein
VPTGEGALPGARRRSSVIDCTISTWQPGPCATMLERTSPVFVPEGDEPDQQAQMPERTVLAEIIEWSRRGRASPSSGGAPDILIVPSREGRSIIDATIPGPCVAPSQARCDGRSRWHYQRTQEQTS